jgi:hypothetical protein
VAEAAEIKQQQLPARLLRRSRGIVVRPAQGQGGMGAVRETEDHVRISAAADPDDFTALTPQGVVGMDNGDKSQRRVGQRGSVLGICLVSATGWCKGRGS